MKWALGLWLAIGFGLLAFGLDAARPGRGERRERREAQAEAGQVVVVYPGQETISPFWFTQPGGGTYLVVAGARGESGEELPSEQGDGLGIAFTNWVSDGVNKGYLNPGSGSTPGIFFTTTQHVNHPGEMRGMLWIQNPAGDGESGSGTIGISGAILSLQARHIFMPANESGYAATGIMQTDADGRLCVVPGGAPGDVLRRGADDQYGRPTFEWRSLKSEE